MSQSEPDLPANANSGLHSIRGMVRSIRLSSAALSLRGVLTADNVEQKDRDVPTVSFCSIWQFIPNIFWQVVIWYL